MKTQVKDNLSFTLVEILLALAILGIGLVGILSVFVVGTNSIRRTVAMTEASFVAQMVLEDFKRQGHFNPSSLTYPPLPEHYTDDGYMLEPDTPHSVLEGGTDNLYKIELGVKKNDKTIVTYVTYITKYEP